ncbi:hypothetical protein [Methylobacterium sp. CM6257]
MFLAMTTSVILVVSTILVLYETLRLTSEHLLRLPIPPRLLAGVEALNGLLLIGWSASFTYLAMERYRPLHGKARIMPPRPAWAASRAGSACSLGAGHLTDAAVLAQVLAQDQGVVRSGLPYGLILEIVGRTMRTFLVTFHKVVPDDRGHDHRVLQQQFVVPACSEDAAADSAKALFCEAAGIINWRLRADTCKVIELAELAA